MLKDLLKEVISIVAGKQAEEIVDLLDTQKHVNEFILAKKLNLTINQVRNILYKISDYGLVSSIRKKDKRKGWYTYFWKIEIVKSLEFLKENLLKKIENVEHQIRSRETKRFYVCERCHIELSEENALLNNFTCTECGAVLTLRDNTKLLKELRKTKERMEKDLSIVNGELEKEREKDEKKRIKEIRKTERKIKAERAKKRAKRMKEKPAKKAVKKSSKKKKVKKKPAKKIKKKVKKKIKKSSKNSKKKVKKKRI